MYFVSFLGKLRKLQIYVNGTFLATMHDCIVRWKVLINIYWLPNIIQRLLISLALFFRPYVLSLHVRSSPWNHEVTFYFFVIIWKSLPGFIMLYYLLLSSCFFTNDYANAEAVFSSTLTIPLKVLVVTSSVPTSVQKFLNRPQPFVIYQRQLISKYHSPRLLNINVSSLFYVHCLPSDLVKYKITGLIIMSLVSFDNFAFISNDSFIVRRR